MVQRASRRARRGQGGGPLRRALALAGLLALGGCASSEDSSDGAASPGLEPPFGGWRDETDGGQTGSLTPRCGLPPLARARGVSTSTGIVVYTSGCPDLSTGLGLFDADGNAVPFETQPIGSGIVLVTPAAGVPPGSYTLGTAPAPVEDQDAGFDQDAGTDPGMMSGGDAGAAPVEGDTVLVSEPSVAPTRLGELRQPRGACSNLLELTLDPAVLPFLSALALDVRVDQGPSMRLAAFGTLLVSPGGVVSIRVPLSLLTAGGASRVSVEAVLASGAFAIAPATIDASCIERAQPAPFQASEDEGEGACGVRSAGARSSASPGWFAALVLLGLWRRRRRRRPRGRPPD